MNNLEKISRQAHFTVNQKFQIEQFAQGITSRDKINPKALLTAPEITGILNNLKLNRIQKGEKILKFLFEKRYPEITGFSLKFNSQKTKLKPVQNFEDSRISIDFTENGDYEIRINSQEK